MAGLSDWANIAQVVAGAAAAGGLIFSGYQIRAQNRATDIQSFLEIHSRIAIAWEKHRLCPNSDSNAGYYFGELVSTYELACFLLNKGTVSKHLATLLEQHIIEVIAIFVTEDLYAEQIEQFRSSPDTYQEMIAFIRRHHVAFEKHRAQLLKYGLIS